MNRTICGDAQQLHPGLVQLHVQADRHSRENSNRTESDNREPTALQTCVDVSLEVGIVRVLFIGPVDEEEYYQLLNNHQKLGIAWYPTMRPGGIGCDCRPLS